jgi:hypothetical protein
LVFSYYLPISNPSKNEPLLTKKPQTSWELYLSFSVEHICQFFWIKLVIVLFLI